MVDIDPASSAAEPIAEPPLHVESAATRVAMSDPTQQPARRTRRVWLLRVITVALVAAIFFALVLAQSVSKPWTADTASVALQGWDLVHLHVLLHGWWASDVNFYTLDAPLYGLCSLIFGLGSTAMHVAGALTYTLVFLAAGWLAKGRTQGSAAWLRVALTAMFMAAPLFDGALLRTMVLVPDHLGTMVFMLVAYVLCCRFAERRWTPWALLIVLTLGQLGDVTVRYVAVPAMLIVWAIDYLRVRQLRTPQTRLMLTTIASVLVSMAMRDVMKHFGAYYLTKAHTAIAPISEWSWHFKGTFLSTVSLFGVETSSSFPGATTGRAIITFIGLAALACALVSMLRVLIRWAHVDVADRLLAVSILVYLAAYTFSTVAINGGGGGGYEFVGVLAMSAVLSVRNLGSVLRPLATRLRPALGGTGNGTGERTRTRATVVGTIAAATAAAVCLVTGTGLFQPPVSDPNQVLAGWLEAHGLKYGLSDYWFGAPATVYSGGRVEVRPVLPASSGFVANPWGSKRQWYEASANDARFVVAQDTPTSTLTSAQTESWFGQPSATYQVDGFTVLVYPYNLLTKTSIPVVPPGD